MCLDDDDNLQSLTPPPTVPSTSYQQWSSGKCPCLPQPGLSLQAQHIVMSQSYSCIVLTQQQEAVSFILNHILLYGHNHSLRQVLNAK